MDYVDLFENIDLKVSDNVKTELDIRLENLEVGKSELYTWDEVKSYLESIREIKS